MNLKLTCTPTSVINCSQRYMYISKPYYSFYLYLLSNSNDNNYRRNKKMFMTIMISKLLKITI